MRLGLATCGRLPPGERPRRDFFFPSRNNSSRPISTRIRGKNGHSTREQLAGRYEHSEIAIADESARAFHRKMQKQVSFVGQDTVGQVRIAFGFRDDVCKFNRQQATHRAAVDAAGERGQHVCREHMKCHRGKIRRGAVHIPRGHRFAGDHAFEHVGAHRPIGQFVSRVQHPPDQAPGVLLITKLAGRDAGDGIGVGQRAQQPKVRRFSGGALSDDMAREIGADANADAFKRAFTMSCDKNLPNTKEMPMAGEEWDSANVDQKLELLRKDLTDIATAQNALAREFRSLTRRIDKLAQDLGALRRNHPKS
jgi:hypothetical protein